MVRKASSMSEGNSKSGPLTSTSRTSTPNERKAFATPVPVAIETAHSDPGPPINTAIFFGNALISLWVAHASRVLVAASRRNNLFREARPAGKRPRWRGRHRQHAGRVRYPETSRFFPHDLHFGFQFDSALFSRDMLNPGDQLQDISCRRAAIIDDKVSVNLRDARLTHARIFQSQLIDQFPRRTTRRILEYA